MNKQKTMTIEPKKITKKKSQTYNTIEQLDAIEHIRLRPGMYIGTNDTPAHLFSEVIDNALDEAANGYCNRIDITYKDHIVTIQDNGRGIPHSKTNKGQEAIIAATENMSGGKFNRDNYAKAVGLHGVGLCAVRALSDFLTISSVRDGEEYCAKFNDANLVSFEKKKVSDNQGTFVQFRPCTKYFESDDIPISYVIERVRVALTEIRKLKIFFNDEELYPYSDEELLANSDIKFPLMSGSDKNNNEMFLRLGYTTVGLQSDEAGSVNLLPVNAGTHVDIAKKALIEAWNLTGYIDDLELKPEDVLVGSHLYASASFVETAWTSQDKKQLKMRIKEFDDLIKSLAKNIMRSIQQLSKESKDALLRKFIDYRESQNRLSTAKYMQGVVKYGDEGKTTKRSFSSDSKLVDCVSEDRESTELFVCEGNSAGSNLISQRDPMIHAVLPLRGKPRNIMEESVETILNNLEMRSIVNSLGTGLMKHERPELCRYGKIIITADADCDGLQISSLVLAALCYLVPKTVLSGRVYLLTAPLYGIFGQNITEFEVEGKEPRYYLSSDKLIVNNVEMLSKDIKKNSQCKDKAGNEFLVKSVKKYDKKEFIPLWECYTSPSIQLKRYKGLGSMSPEESKIALLSDKRRLQMITGTSIDKVMKLVGETEFKKILMKQNDILDWQC